MSLDEIFSAEKEIGLHDRSNLDLRVFWSNKLREIISVRAPRNKIGSPIISDIDVLCAEPKEREDALIAVINKVNKKKK